jgi:beta-lactam-binding protein with PASTA domain
VPLLDGKYEILSERPLGAGATRFDATTPAGATVRVVWYDLEPQQEAAFERFRRLLKRLARDGSASVADVVSRPGARYVAWLTPAPGLAPGRDPAVEAALREAGFDPETATLLRDGRSVRLFDLPFHPGAVAPPPPPASPEPGSATRRTPWTRLPPLSDDALAWLLTFGLLVTAAAGFGGGFLARANDRAVQVPELLGRGVEEAAAAVQALGLRVDPVAVASDAPAGAVLAVDPPAGAALRPGRSVRLTYAVAPGRLAPAEVPQLVGAQGEEAVVERLGAAGLRLGRVAHVHAEVPQGAVLAQSEPPGTTLGQGQGVDVLISLGPRPESTFLPDLVGLDLEDALYVAAVAGLGSEQVIVESVASDRALPGSVVSQSLAPFQRVPRTEATLRLLVAAEPLLVEADPGLPSLAGMPEADARLLANGFEIRIEHIEDRALPDGVVLQSLPVGARPEDGPLVLTVNVRPVPVPRPDVAVVVRPPELRRLQFTWFVEPGIPVQTAEVTARTLRGDEVVVLRRQVRGGDVLTGSWSTTAPGPVRFALTLNGEPYGGELLVP